MKYAISSCLMGIQCKYNGGHNAQFALMEFMHDKEYILICPEVEGGLSTPRACCEIIGDRVINTKNTDVTEAFKKGAEACIQKIIKFDIDLVITQPRSPSCGKGKVYDGTFSQTLIVGDGIFVQMCRGHGCKVLNVDEFLFDMKTKI